MRPPSYLCLALLLGLSKSAFLPTFTANNPMNCSGNYYMAINTFIVDCFDILGTPTGLYEQPF